MTKKAGPKPVHRDWEPRDGSDRLWIVCPRCAALAFARQEYSEQTGGYYTPTCPACGQSKRSRELIVPVAACRTRWVDGSDPRIDAAAPLRLEPWLTAPFRGRTVWAWNPEHLALVQSYVGAELRERRQRSSGWYNRSTESRLPRFMVLRKNREPVLRVLEKLALRTAEAGTITTPRVLKRRQPAARPVRRAKRASED